MLGEIFHKMRKRKPISNSKYATMMEHPSQQYRGTESSIVNNDQTHDEMTNELRNYA